MAVIATGKESIPPDLFYRAAVALIDQQPDPDARADLRERFEERAAIAEYDAGLNRQEAERLAFRDIRQVLGLA